MSDSALVSGGILFLLTGVATVVGLRLAPKKAGRRGQQLRDTLERPLRRMRLLAPEEFYRAMAVPVCLFFILTGVIMIAIGILA